MPSTFAYRFVDLSSLHLQALEITFNQLGADGWELVAIAPPHRAILKRETEAAPEKAAAHAVAPKYRDPETGETWSGRGRMATWLADRIKAGGRLDDFLA